MQEKTKVCLTNAVDNIRFSGVIEGGFCWEVLTRERMKNPKSLEPYGYKVYSQNDEDGILHEIFERIGTVNKTFVEFGVQDGLESNCHLLLFYGWKGLWIEGSPEYCRMINMKFRPVIESGQLQIKNVFITKDNINKFIDEYTGGGIKEIDLLSIDIDGNDIYIWEAIHVVNPRVVITEYNGKFPPDLEWRQAYNPTHIWHEDDWHGASLKAFEKVGKAKGYRLVGTSLRGANAFFVRDDLVRDLFYEPATAEALYNPLRLDLQFKSSHPAKFCLAMQKDYLGLLNYQAYELVEGFHAEESADEITWSWTSATESIIRLLVTSDTTSIQIPYSLPKEVIAQNKNYEIVFFIKDSEILRQKVLDETGVFVIGIDSSLVENLIVELHISIPFLWKPCELIGISDQRSLGINIILSKIIIQ